MFPDFSENSTWKLNILISKSATDTCLVYWLCDSTWAKPEVNRAAYDLFIMRTLMGF